ncbi:MAG: tryptophan synthase subunit alpha [Bacillota bacterium]|nr:tryptophan synthase subunit alpha [Bacillota bacterium]
MSRIEKKFNELKELNKKALITFVTAGDPNLEGTKKIVIQMEKDGADIIELGIPYSDPIAEGPVIQAANERALKNSIRIKDIFDMVKDMRVTAKVPLVFLLYFNCIFKYGPDKFFSDCVSSGVDGVIIPDLPFEESDELDEVVSKYDVDIISLVAPTSKERIEKIAKRSKGFLYCVSSLGVTGVRNKFSTDFNEFFSYINKYTSIPKAIGFGISTPEHIKNLKGYCDGLIVGSAMVKQVERSSNIDEAVKNVSDYVKTLREAMDS